MHAWSDPQPDVLGDGWLARTLDLARDATGQGVATLVHRADAGTRPRAMLYLHGYVDYFFHSDHAREWAEHGYDVYALDLRDYGRSIRPGREPNWITDLNSYDEEIDAALAFVRGQGHEVVVLDGHSTGGLIAVLYAHTHPGTVDALVLNSPWFDLNASWFERVISTRVIDRLGARRPMVRVSSFDEPYGRSLHRSTGGEWDYDLAWKPFAGFPVRAGLGARDPSWARTRGTRAGDHRAGARRHLRSQRPSQAPHRGRPRRADCVLDVKQIWARAALLGPKVTVLRIPGGRHDLTLSAPAVRERYSALMFDWLADALG